MNKFIGLLLVVLLLAVDAKSKAMVGTNMGGWMVLEPWITPSMFYRFLGKTHKEGVGFDQYTFCEALGPETGNKVLKAHWKSWVNEDMIKGMASRGIETVRLPIGDWTLRQYGPYVGCTDGADKYIDWFMDMCHKHGIKVLLDVHCVKDSQNGFDNSGKASNMKWLDENHFMHWEILAGNWMGNWNGTHYDHINQSNINFAVETVSMLLDRWGSHPALYALEPVNEPWWNSDMMVLKNFYRVVRRLIQIKAPDVLFVFHDAFKLDANLWNDLFEDTKNVVLDHHYYSAWWPKMDTIGEYCDHYGSGLNGVKSIKYDVWIGEWALATDTCAMWLGGFNDRNSDLVFQCQEVDCPKSYLPYPYNVDFDRNAKSLGPYGTRAQTVHYGKCYKDSAYFNFDDVNTLGQCYLSIFDDLVEGHFFWTYRNEIEERWNYQIAYDNGWIKAK
eukprot:TRINITY_DN779931_c0_g1_i1.p1 TRINITY_DN779931_c0_g1~~TRINITY_DN779931_c0_g1_i1.p1  ORF type:complete len:444 (-),score=106.18 TRINITY_DN779931_c0_g1_i1:500-1831(-)